MTFMQSGTDSASDFMSMWVTARLPSDTAGAMQTPVEVPAGTGQAKYTDFGQRAGDLSGINVDQSDGSFWAANEFANTEAFANWGTAIANFTAAKTDAWSGGGSDGNWTTAANWVGNMVPVAGDALVFPAGAAGLSNTNNFSAGTGFSSITISGSGYSLAGNRVLTGAIDASGTIGTNNLLVDVSLTGNRMITAPAAAGNQLDLGNLDNGGDTLTVTGGLGTVLVSGGISGVGGLTMNATGDLVLQNNNTFGGYAGPTLISSGTVSLTGNASLSSSSAVTVNGTFDLGGLNDTLASLSGSGNITLGSGTLTIHVVPFPGTTF